MATIPTLKPLDWSNMPKLDSLIPKAAPIPTNAGVLSQIGAMSRPAAVPTSGVPASLLTGVIPAGLPFGNASYPGMIPASVSAPKPAGLPPGFTPAGSAETPRVPPGGATVVGPGGTVFLPGGTIIPPGFNMPDVQPPRPGTAPTAASTGATPVTGVPANVSQWPEWMNGIERDRLTMQQEQQRLDETYRTKLYDYQKSRDTLTDVEDKRRFDELRALDNKRLEIEGLSLDRTFALETAKFILQVWNTPEYSAWWSQTGATPQQLAEAVQRGQPLPMPQFRGAVRSGVAAPEGAAASTGPLELLSNQQWNQLTPSLQAAMRGQVAAAGVPIEDYLRMVSGTVPVAGRLP